MHTLDLSPYLSPFLGNHDFSAEPITDGHIHDGWYIQSQHKTYPQTILQKINTHVFSDPFALMENIYQITNYLAQQNPFQKQLRIIKTLHGEFFHTASNGTYWRLYQRIENGYTTQNTRNLTQIHEAGRVTGEFLSQLQHYPVHSLNISIPNFHNTPKRYQDFLDVLSMTDNKAVDEIHEEIEFLQQRAEKFSIIWEALHLNRIPWRVTHNDTKLDNVLFDRDTHQAICLIDLDTIMPGSALFDFGDALRAMGNPASEDEPDLGLVEFQLPVFEAYTQGYATATKNILSEQEVSLLPISPWIITIEIGMRFLMDYLQGDQYFRTHYPKQNLNRCRTQFKLATDMENKFSKMEKIVNKIYIGKYYFFN